MDGIRSSTTMIRRFSEFMNLKFGEWIGPAKSSLFTFLLSIMAFYTVCISLIITNICCLVTT